MSRIKSTGQKLTLLASLLGSSFSLMAADIDMSVDQNDLAIKGYDPVAYFTDQGAVQGNSQFTATYKNAIYHFASSENRDQFRADPQAYAPQYGGYCAFGVAMGKKFETDPQAWKIEDGKLYLNLDKTVQKRWLEDTQGFIQDANGNWPTIKTVAADQL
ncbi:YHS domain-containing protein [Vibrio coralliilyticus]|uniref:YHS domain-containing (seleno)protein n=1 Tax=Vibrio coralliilyticus TaxID=190893 RepID=UPI00148D6D65|nr:YHS domain-containing (seleno)protein [Vibrio coralliilyticus]NOH55473.1 YHS domain-containing protein [Vibrio coralliilyticus]